MGDLLLGIVRRVGEYSGKEPSFHSVTAGNNNTMLPCFQKLVVKKHHPLGVHKLPGAVSHEGVTWSFPSCSLTDSEILEGPWKL
jgi:hypothetical protein